MGWFGPLLSLDTDGGCNERSLTIRLAFENAAADFASVHDTQAVLRSMKTSGKTLAFVPIITKYGAQNHCSSALDPPLFCLPPPQVDSGKINIVSELPASSASSAAQGVGHTKRAAGTANASEASFEFLSATFGATLPRGHVSVVPSVPEDACHPIAPLAAVSSSSSGSTGDVGRGGGNVGGQSDGVAPVAVLVKRGACAFGVKAKNVQVLQVGGGGGRA